MTRWGTTLEGGKGHYGLPPSMLRCKSISVKSQPRAIIGQIVFAQAASVGSLSNYEFTGMRVAEVATTFGDSWKEFETLGDLLRAVPG